MNVADVLLGRRLANREYHQRRITAFEGVPAVGLDGLVSSAYGPEAALTVLIPLGAASFTYIGWIMAPIVALLTIAGHRPVFTAGILYLGIAAGLLLFIFGGITDHLIPLFAVGAFLTFTISQTGMIVHWWRTLRNASHDARRSHSIHLGINAVGALTTAVALVVIVATKFASGAWITLLAIPVAIGVLKAIRGYYDEVARRVRDPLPLRLDDTRPPLVLVATESWNKLTDKALRFALSLSPGLIAVHFTQLAGPGTPEDADELRAQWRIDVELPARRAGLNPPRLVILQARYRAMHEPLIRLIREIQSTAQGRRIAVLIPEIVRQHWYQFILHTMRPPLLRTQLLRYGGPGVVVIDVPWYLEQAATPPELDSGILRPRAAEAAAPPERSD